MLSKISGKEMKVFARLYACAHSDFALALIEKYWKPERGNYEEIVDACFAHTNEDCALFEDPKLDWRKIEKDLVAVMKKAMAMRRKGNVIDAAEWNTFLTKLLDEADWEIDYDEADIKIAIAEKRFDRIKPAIECRAYRAGELYKSYVKYIPKQDLAFVGELINDNIRRLALLYEKPKQYAYLRDEVNSLMGLSSTVDKVVKDCIRRLITEYPNKHYIGNYLRQLL